MQQNTDQHKQQELEALERLVQLERVESYQHYHQFRHLSSRYPLQFIYFMRKHREGKVRKHQDMLDRGLPIAQSIVNDYYLKLQRYFIYGQATEKDNAELENSIEKLEDLLLRQNKEN